MPAERDDDRVMFDVKLRRQLDGKLHRCCLDGELGFRRRLAAAIPPVAGSPSGLVSTRHCDAGSSKRRGVPKL